MSDNPVEFKDTDACICLSCNYQEPHTHGFACGSNCCCKLKPFNMEGKIRGPVRSVEEF